MIAAMHAQTLIDGFVQHEYDLQGIQTRHLTSFPNGNAKSEVRTPADNPLRLVGDPITEIEKFVYEEYPKFQQIFGNSGRFDLEHVLTSSVGGLYPVPTDIARRLDSPNNEIQEILDNGGHIYYLDPLIAGRFDSEIRKQQIENADSPVQRLVVGVLGSPQQNLSAVHPMGNPIHELYPFPPIHRVAASDRTIFRQTSNNWDVIREYTVTAGTPWGSGQHPLPSDQLVRVYGNSQDTDFIVRDAESMFDPFTDNLNHQKGYGSFWMRNQHRNGTGDRITHRHELWGTTTWEWQARIESLDPSDPTNIRSNNTANRWADGIEAYRQLANNHWNRILVQIHQIPRSRPGAEPPEADGELIGPTINKTKWVVSTDSNGMIRRDEFRNPIMVQTTGTEIVKWPTLDGALMQIEGNIQERDDLTDWRGWTRPGNGLPISTLSGTDILEEDGDTSFDNPAETMFRGLPSLERRIAYRSAALALWAKVRPGAPRDINGKVKSIMDPNDTNKIFVQNSGGEILGDLTIYDQSWKGGNEDGHLVEAELPTGSTYLPWDRNPFNPAFANVFDPEHSDFDEAYIDSLHPAAIWALSHVGHAAMMVTGYKPPFYEEQNDQDSANDTLLVDTTDTSADADWRAPYKAVQPTLYWDPQDMHWIDRDGDGNGDGLAAKEEWTQVRLSSGSLVNFDPASGILDLTGITSSIFNDRNGELRSGYVHERDVNGDLVYEYDQEDFGFPNVDVARAIDTNNDGIIDITDHRLIYLTDPSRNLRLLRNPYHNEAYEYSPRQTDFKFTNFKIVINETREHPLTEGNLPDDGIPDSMGALRIRNVGVFSQPNFPANTDHDVWVSSTAEGTAENLVDVFVEGVTEDPGDLTTQTYWAPSSFPAEIVLNFSKSDINAGVFLNGLTIQYYVDPAEENSDKDIFGDVNEGDYKRLSQLAYNVELFGSNDTGTAYGTKTWTKISGFGGYFLPQERTLPQILPQKYMREFALPALDPDNTPDLNDPDGDSTSIFDSVAGETGDNDWPYNEDTLAKLIAGTFPMPFSNGRKHFTGTDAGPASTSHNPWSGNEYFNANNKHESKPFFSANYLYVAADIPSADTHNHAININTGATPSPINIVPWSGRTYTMTPAAVSGTRPTLDQRHFMFNQVTGVTTLDKTPDEVYANLVSAMNGDPDFGQDHQYLDVDGSNSLNAGDVITAHPMLQWTKERFDYDGDGHLDDNYPGPILHRRMVGPVVNKFPPPYADSGAIDLAGNRKYQIEHRLQIRWYDEEGNETEDVTERVKPEYGLLRWYVSNDTDANDMDSQWAHSAHETAIRAAAAYVARHPYDISVPRPLNRQSFIDRGIYAQDLFDASGNARRPQNYTELHKEFYPLVWPETPADDPARFGAPTTRTEFVNSMDDWSKSYDFYSSSVRRDRQGRPNDIYGYNSDSTYRPGMRPDTMNIFAHALPQLSGLGEPFIFGSPKVHPTDDLYGVPSLSAFGGTTEITTPMLLQNDFAYWDSWYGTEAREGAIQAATYLDDDRQRYGGSSTRVAWNHDTGEPGYPAKHLYAYPRLYNHVLNLWNGHGIRDDTWHTHANKQGGTASRFHHTDVHDANHRTRQLVYWLVDWQKYEDAETAPGVPIDASRLPQTVTGLSTLDVTRASKKSYIFNEKVYFQRGEQLVLTLDSPTDGTVEFTVECWHYKNPGTTNLKMRYILDVTIDGVTYTRGDSYPDGYSDLDTWMDDQVGSGGTIIMSLVDDIANYVSRNDRFPLGHPERNFAWYDTDRTVTRYKWERNEVLYSTPQSITGATFYPPNHNAMVLSDNYGFNGGNDLIEQRDLELPMPLDLIPFGADRNGNGELDIGPVLKTTRMRAQPVARFNFYDPVSWQSLKR
jgi:hypothetical protein